MTAKFSQYFWPGKNSNVEKIKNEDLKDIDFVLFLCLFFLKRTPLPLVNKSIYSQVSKRAKTWEYVICESSLMYYVVHLTNKYAQELGHSSHLFLQLSKWLHFTLMHFVQFLSSLVSQFLVVQLADPCLLPIMSEKTP